jgi:uncharacterized protein (TIGR02588 family)
MKVVASSTSNTPRWEKILGFLGLLLLLAGFIYLGWMAFNENESPPEITFEITEITPLENGYLVQLDVHNEGAQSVAAMHFEGYLDGSERETSRAVIDYVPSLSRSSAGLFFTHDPRAGKLTFKALGYQKP